MNNPQWSPDQVHGAPPTAEQAIPVLIGVDVREQLFNEGAVGTFEAVQRSEAMIYQPLGILYDLDPSHIQRSSITPEVPTDPREFYLSVVRLWLNRHRVLAKAEVRISGTGLHVILQLSDPPQLDTDSAMDRWKGTVQVLQAALPIDTDQPHITAVTRPIGSINSKNNARVEQLKEGKKVSREELEEFYQQMSLTPFCTVFQILTGVKKLKPCPICNDPKRTLSAMDRVGRCYGGCGNKVKLSQLYDVVLKPRSTTKHEEVQNVQ